jgi:hypothetical protein
MSLANSQVHEPQPQGRYLFVILPFVAYCIALYVKEVQNFVAARYRSSSGDIAAAAGYRLGYNFVVIVLALLTTGMLVVNIFAAFLVLAPAYVSEVDTSNAETRNHSLGTQQTAGLVHSRRKSGVSMLENSRAADNSST